MALMLPVAFWFVQSGEQGFACLISIHGCRIDSHIGADQCVGAGELHYCQSFAGVQLVRLLSYVEPVLLLGVALLLGERIKAGEWLTYIPIWLAVMVLVYEGFKHLVRQRRA
jgi:chloramphenicol-sensitive protein RarD